ncbi:MATE family efflux transporter [Jiulongibacter sediminis]|uniref:Multidrug-efflux transporter n=1 Tax=Jiulongibacter sediminis TaxID=1605367 RepID=A0A0N8HAD8_9BACT|nr:MATE family efflux transporter [Jiulongibacter sediminis]KPM49892.1 multidrug transporter MatE [Jiulongibacter sediminis]TBX26929.1 multidrug transporter MatE [Jiulongibacter sediminis]
MSKFFQLIKDALKGDENTDFTTLSINRAIVLLSVPMVIEMFFEALFALADAFFVARYVGTLGVAAVGLTESVLTLIYSVAWGLSGAATAIVARRIGEKDNRGGGVALAQVILISLLLGAVIAFFGTFYAEKVLELMGGSPELIAQGKWYTRIQFLSSPVIILIFTLSGALRGSGSASLAMKSVIIANILNIGLDFLFVPIMGMGIKGAALATLIGRSVGVIYQLWMLIKFSKLQLRWPDFTPVKKIIVNIIKIGSGGAGQFLIQSASWVFLVRILSEYGSEVIAGYTVALRIIVFTILPSWGLANSAATLVGQNLGAGKPERAIKSAWTVSFFNMVFLAIIAVVFFLFAEDFISWFDPTPQVVATGVLCLKILAAGYVVFGIGMVITQAINGAGDTLPPTLFNIICFWIIEIPLAYYLAVMIDWKETGVFLSIIIAETILAIMAVVYFRTNRWQRKQV